MSNATPPRPNVIRPTMKPDRDEARANQGTLVHMYDTDYNGPPAPPRDPITLVEATKWKDGNDYTVGSTVYFNTATFTGGDPDQTITRWRLQKREGPDDSWINYSWTNYTTGGEECNITCPAGQMRIHCQARDNSVDPVQQVNSMAPSKTVASRTIGDISVTVNDIDYDYNTAPALTVLMNDPLPVVVTISGDAEATYKWEARNDYPLMVGQQAAHTVLTLPEAGACTVTCTITDGHASDSPTSIVINFWVVDAKTWEELGN